MSTQVKDHRDTPNDAVRFLGALGGGHHFRTIPEAPNAKGRARKYGAFDPAAIGRDNGAGAGVFVVVNAGGDTDASITAVRAIFLDIDRKTFASDDECELAILFAHEGRQGRSDPIPVGWPHASIIVRSGGGGAHLFWLIDDCPVARFKPVQQALAKRFNGDAAVCNSSRVMRLPGTIHWKSGAPIPVRLPLCRPERRYKLDDLLQRLGVVVDELDVESHRIDPLEFNGRPQTSETVAALRDALKRLDKSDPEAVNDRKTWLRVLMSVHAHGWGEVGRTIAAEWSAQSSKFDKDRFAVDWASLKSDGAVSPSTLYWLAGADQRSDCPDVGTDDGLACRFAAWLGGRVMYSRGRFHSWTGSYWRPDHIAVEGLLKTFAKENARQALESFFSNPEGSSEKYQNRAAKSLLSVGKQSAVLDSLRVTLAVPDDQLDKHPMLFAVPSGLVDLDKGVLMAANPSAYCTRCAGVDLGSATQIPNWLAFLNRIFAGDVQVIAFVQRWFGYCLTGSMAEEKLLFGYGIGANGKSVFANVQQYIMGHYAATADSSLLMGSHRDAASPSPELARLAGARLVLLNESKAGDRLDDGTVKRLVSTEKMAARGLYQDVFEFFPTGKLFLRSNHRPTVRDDTEGLWRRVMLLPFSVQIPHEQQDLGLFEKLKTEGPGILAWAVQGCLEWKRIGLRPPKCVSEATDAYRSDSDAIGEWLDVRTEGGGETPTATLLDDYARFAGLRYLPTARAFAGMLKDRGIEQHRTSKSRGYKITLKSPPSTDAGIW